MRTWNWLLSAALLTSMSAVAQQQGSQPSATSPSPDAAQAAQPADASAAPQSQPVQAQGSQAAPAAQVTPAPPAPAAAPVTMDQVVSLFIEREHGLIKALAARTPVVETYLQNLSSDAQLGPVPSEDHYFLGRMDMGENIDRKDYLKEQEKSMQTRLMGGFAKLYKVQYQPLGFSWMVYADRTDFDREH